MWTPRETNLLQCGLIYIPQTFESFFTNFTCTNCTNTVGFPADFHLYSVELHADNNLPCSLIFTLPVTKIGVQIKFVYIFPLDLRQWFGTRLPNRLLLIIVIMNEIHNPKSYPDIVKLKRYFIDGRIIDADDEYLSTSKWRNVSRLFRIEKNNYNRFSRVLPIDRIHRYYPVPPFPMLHTISSLKCKYTF